MNAQILIQAVIQQSTVFLAQLATAGGLRPPLVQVANQVFLDLSKELQNQGLRKTVIADMFGLTLRTYHRKIRELSQSRSVEGQSLWEATLEFIRTHEPVSASRVHERFANDEHDAVVSVLVDLVNSGFTYRTGRGASSVFRIADASDFQDDCEPSRQVANEYLVWQAIYRARAITRAQLVQQTRLTEEIVESAVNSLIQDERVAVEADGTLSSQRIDVPVGQAQGWEAAVFDHYQAMVGAICAKLSARETRSERGEFTGGATYSLDLWPNHPLESEILGTLQRVRDQLESLRKRVDEHNESQQQRICARLIFYFGQHFCSDRETPGG